MVTGATDPDRITDFCAAAGVRTINLDLPGRLAPSIVSDNFGGAQQLTRLIMSRLQSDFGTLPPLWFIGGHARDHNTAERLRGFRAAHEQAGLAVPDHQIIMPGYSPDKAAAALSGVHLTQPAGLFVNSTIALEGVVRWLGAVQPAERVRLGCFDWDPFAALLPQNVGTVQQDVPSMLKRLFDTIETAPDGNPRLEVPCLLRPAV